ncbi:xanthine dehydrogenase, molybdenum binding subunit [hydrocarbon metagenome]|uniref:Xanthine dehydrogenase, molybdenum binding subunit n=1 Tax=hydrocarbon metagenome TaxID=938273 RepID=A0A0W8E1E2_9ZZZZ
MEDISQAIKRFDFDEKIDGSACYCADVRYDGMLYARTLRSSKTRAKITDVEIPPLPDDYYIVDHNDIPGKNIVPMVFEDQPFLARERVNYIGEPILLVVGPDRQVIADILAQVRVTYEEIKPILTMAEAEQPQEEYIFADKPWFVEYKITKGNMEEARARSSLVAEDEFYTGYQEQAYLEPQAVLAVYEEERVTVYGSMQCPYYIKDALIQAFNWPEDRLRVVQLPTGGGFGGKEDYPSLIAVHAALAALKTGRPVQLILERQEDIIASTKRHPARIRIKSYIDDKQHITGRDIDISMDAGAYAGLSSVVLQRMLFSVGGVYKVENLQIQARAYATNKVVSGAFRGFGGPQAFFAIEMHMENIARQLGVDSLGLKRKHFFHRGDSSSTGGLFQYEIKLEEIADEIEKMSAYREKRDGYGDSRDKLQGIGCSIFFHGCGFAGSGEKEILKSKVRLKKNRDDTVEIFVSSTEMGQGALSTLRKIVAETLEVPVESVMHNYPDTDCCPDSGPTVASRTVMIVGKLLHECALEIKDRWSEGEVDLIKDYVYPDNLHWDNDRLQGNAYPEYSWGANVVEVEIDPVSYELNITGIWAIYDVGTPIDEKIVRGQIEGGMVQGLGYGGMEVLTARQGRLLQTNLTNYMIPTALDFPPIESKLIDNPYEEGPFGARGLGELTLVGAAPALALAVQNAIGRKVTEIPITPEYIMELMLNDQDDQFPA